MFKTNCSSLEHQYKELGAFFNQKRGNRNLTFPIFDNEFLSSAKQLQIGPKYFIFPIKHEDICDYNPWCFKSRVLILYYIILNLFSDTTKQKN